MQSTTYSPDAIDATLNKIAGCDSVSNWGPIEIIRESEATDGVSLLAIIAIELKRANDLTELQMRLANGLYIG